MVEMVALELWAAALAVPVLVPLVEELAAAEEVVD